MLIYDKDKQDFIAVADEMNNPYLHHKDGDAAKIVRDYIATHDDGNSPVFGDKEIFDILGMVNTDTGILDPKTAVVYGIYYGLALAEG